MASSDTPEFDESTDTVVENQKLKGLIKRRGVEKGKLTLFKRFIDKIDSKIPLTAEQILEIESRLEKMYNVYDQCEAIQDGIQTISDSEQELAEREVYTNTYYQYIAKAKRLIVTVGESSSPRSQPRASMQATFMCQESVKFPDISLPSLTGDMTTWIEFRDTFDGLVNKSNLKPIQRFSR